MVPSRNRGSDAPSALSISTNNSHKNEAKFPTRAWNQTVGMLLGQACHKAQESRDYVSSAFGRACYSPAFKSGSVASSLEARGKDRR